MTIFGIEISELAVIFADYIIVFLFFKNYLGQINGGRLKNILGAFVFVAVFAITYKLFYGNTAVAMPQSFLTYFSVAFLLFDGKWYWKLLASFLYFIILHLIDLFAMFGLMWIANVDAQEIFNGNGTLYFCGVIISKVLLLFTTQLIGHTRNKENKRLSFEYWIAIVTFPTISSILVYLLFEFNWRLQTTEVTVTTIIALFGILYINFFAFRLINFFADKTERDTKDAVIRQNYEKQVAECQRLDYMVTSRGKFFHDIKHFKSTLEELVKKRDVEKALQLLEEVLQLEAVQTKEYVHTSNSVINALFNYHISKAEKNGIRVDVGDLFFPKNLKLDIADLCSIFGNSLENAVEACMRMERDEKFITIGLRYSDNELVYRITNSTDGKIVKGKNWYASTKKTAELSGLGIEIMENAVQKYGGTFGAEPKFDIKTTRHIFETGFVIPSN